MYYTLSIILGTVALSYGSVPMYKMVRLSTSLIDARAHWTDKILSLHNRYAKRLAGAANLYEHRATVAPAVMATLQAVYNQLRAQSGYG
jgi:hypothetical protein